MASISPTGDSEGSGGRQWLYSPDDEYAAVRQIVADGVEGCEQIIANGFSNGSAFARRCTAAVRRSTGGSSVW